MHTVEINKVQFGTAKSVKEKNGVLKFENFKVGRWRQSFLGVNWKELGPVDFIHNPEKKRIRILPHGKSSKEDVIIEAKIANPPFRLKPGEVVIEVTTGEGRNARPLASLYFHIPDRLPSAVSTAKPKKRTIVTPEKSKKQRNR